jgi:RNA polymerase sigma factor (sigma-70 family)
VRPVRSDPLADPAPLVRRVYAYVAYRIGDGPDAEDVTSEVFERALRYRHTYDRSKGEPAAWLVGIARRCLISRPHPIPVDHTLDAASEEGPEEDVLRRVALAEGLLLLGPRDRELVALRYGADLTARQIAALLDLRENTVEVALHRALTRLRLHLEGSDRPELEHLPAVSPVRV